MLGSFVLPDMIAYTEGEYTFMMHDRMAVYRFILQYMQEKAGASPVYSQIMAACGIRSLSTVSRMLKDLEKEGKIKIETRMGSRPTIIIPGARWVPPEEVAALLDGVTEG